MLFKAFIEWVSDTLTLDYLGRKYNVAPQTLCLKFPIFLENSPDPREYFLKLKAKMRYLNENRRKSLKFQKVFGGYLMLDGDWFGRKRVLIIYKDYPTGKILLWRHDYGEYKESIYQDIRFLLDNGYLLNGVTSDWKSSIVYAVRDISMFLGRDIPHQRCLVHTQRLAQALLTRNPKTQPGVELLELVQCFNDIKLPYEENILLKWLHRWGDRHRDFINERTYSEDKRHWWHAHKNLRRVWRTLSRNTDSLFLYLKHPVPKDTNGIEGVFSQLDTKLSRHRGMSRKRREDLISWYFYLREFPDSKPPPTNT